MSEVQRPKGRPGRYAKFEQFEASLPAQMSKRPLYCDGIGLFRGANSYTVWVKIKLMHGGIHKGRSIAPGAYVERKLGKRTSWTWEQLITERDRLQGLADRGEELDAAVVPTFTAFATEWLERRKPTLRSYGVTKGNVHSVLIPAFGKKALNAITVADINRWTGKQSARLKSSSVQRQLNTFNAILNSAVRDGYIDRNPAERADKLKAGEARQRFVTEEEWNQILKFADAIEQVQEEQKELTPHQRRGWLRHFLVWAYNSGMRRAEIHALTWDDVRKTDIGTTVIEVTNTKTGNPRFVTCTDDMLTTLDALRQLERADGDKRLFPVSMTTLKRTLTRLWKSTGLNDVRLHDLRRSHATILISRNVDVRTVAGRLGHSNTSMLAKHYAVNLGDMAAARVFGQRSVASQACDDSEEETAIGSMTDSEQTLSV
jgi:integrase